MNERVRIRRLEAQHSDHRGFVAETYRASDFPSIPPIAQLTRSTSVPKTLRGLHMHKEQYDIWYFVEGEALVRLIQDGTEMFLYGDLNSTIIIPPGVYHGFYTETGCTLLYGLTKEYDGLDEYNMSPFANLTEDSNQSWPRSPEGINMSERDLSS